MGSIFDVCPKSIPDGLITVTMGKHHPVYGVVQIIEVEVDNAAHLHVSDTVTMTARLTLCMRSLGTVLSMRMRVLPSVHGRRPIEVEVRGPADEESVSILAIGLAEVLKEMGLLGNPMYAKL